MSGGSVLLLFMLALVGVWSLGWAVDRMAAALTEARREHLEAGERQAIVIPLPELAPALPLVDRLIASPPDRLTQAQLDEIEFYREPLDYALVGRLVQAARPERNPFLGKPRPLD